MKLKDYRKQHGFSVNDVAAALRVTAVSVRFWEAEPPGRRKIPCSEKMIEIYQWSHGHVSPNDFYDLPLPRGQRPQPAVSDVSPAVNGRACAAAVFPSPDDEDGDRAAQADLFPDFRLPAGHHAEASS